MLYKQLKAPWSESTNTTVMREDGACIPPDPANTDYQTFKADLTEGVELQDAEGNVMTPEQVAAFLGTLP